MQRFVAILILLALAGCTDPQGGRAQSGEEPSSAEGSGAMTGTSKTVSTRKITKTNAQWRAQLTPAEYRVMREKGTERAFTGEYWDEKRKGTYACRACDLPLFTSGTKFKSGTGWPSFWQPIADGRVAEESDTAFGMRRTEVLCQRCDAHLGHLFEDGPKPTGLRYCINSASLRLDATK